MDQCSAILVEKSYLTQARQWACVKHDLELLTAHTFLGLTIPILLQFLDRYIHITLSRDMSLLLSAPILAATVYAAIAGAYLLVIPLMVLFYFKARWYKTGSIERVFLCFLAFFFFPGLLLLSPFFNFRPEARQI